MVQLRNVNQQPNEPSQTNVKVMHSENDPVNYSRYERWKQHGTVFMYGNYIQTEKQV